MPQSTARDRNAPYFTFRKFCWLLCSITFWTALAPLWGGRGHQLCHKDKIWAQRFQYVGEGGTNYCCSPPTPQKTEGLLHTRTSFPADVHAEAGSSNLNSWAGASLKKNTIFCYSFSNFLWHEKFWEFCLLLGYSTQPFTF